MAVAPRACRYSQPTVLEKRSAAFYRAGIQQIIEGAAEAVFVLAPSQKRAFGRVRGCAPASPPAESAVVLGQAFIARFLQRAAALGISVSPATLSWVRGREAHEDLIACDILVAGLCLVPRTRKGQDGPAGEPQPGAGRTE